ncbi:hypothetical protein AB0I81_57410 [Nonomuraea sp. NPDC050404]|uniref:hypothetical protein n=1 Tax=Nonomuraea sp. NPDC050404 TaxID=3155783 RepID=UPI0034050B4B
MNNDPERRRVAFRPRLWRRIVQSVGPFVVMPLAFGMVGSLQIDLSGELLYFVIALGFVLAGAVAVRNALMGITIDPEAVVIVNAFETIRIPTERLESFLWEDYGLSVVWGDGDYLRFTPVQAFHRLRNPMADLTHGLEVWERLTALTGGTPPQEQPVKPKNVRKRPRRPLNP